jgi:methyl-accepting chemotaxis protein
VPANVARGRAYYNLNDEFQQAASRFNTNIDAGRHLIQPTQNAMPATATNNNSAGTLLLQNNSITGHTRSTAKYSVASPRS